MNRTASEGLVLVKEEAGNISLIEINSETDFVAKNKDFINFCKELSEINFSAKSDLKKIEASNMNNGISVKDNLVNLIAKIGKKLQLEEQIILVIVMVQISFMCIQLLTKELVKLFQ